MKYSLILKNGQVMKFFILSVAEMYQSIYGGVVLNENEKPVLRLVA